MDLQRALLQTAPFDLASLELGRNLLGPSLQASVDGLDVNTRGVASHPLSSAGGTSMLGDGREIGGIERAMRARLNGGISRGGVGDGGRSCVRIVDVGLIRQHRARLLFLLGDASVPRRGRSVFRHGRVVKASKRHFSFD